MKVVEHWTRLDFNVVVQAEFIRNGHEIDLFGKNKVDVVRFELTIYNPYKRKEDLYKGYKAHEFVQESRERWWHKWDCETISIGNAYEEKMAEIIKDSNAHIDSRASNKETTDGLPDSLKNL